MPLFLCSAYRIGNNLPLYNTSIVPPHLPGGGGFSIYQYTLENLYTMHQHVRNWWTKSNLNLPLVRYIKCIFKIYQSEDVDIVFRYQRHFPMEATQLTYPTMQPSVLMMLNKTILIPSKKTRRLRKGYKKIIIRPPEIMTNKWFFQQKIATTPLLITYATAASFDHYYIAPENLSNNITIYCLNTALVQNRNMGTNNAYPIRVIGTEDIWLIASDDVLVRETDMPKYKSLILLGNIKQPTEGHTFESAQKLPGQSPALTWQKYCENLPKYMGNLFEKSFLNYDKTDHYTLFQYKGDYKNIFNNSKNPDSTVEQTLTRVHFPLLIPCRYNPNTDKGDTTQTYLLKNNRGEHGWDPPQDKRLELTGFPLYINLWGFLDFQKKQHLLTNIDTSTILVIKSNQIHPLYDTQLPAFVPLSYDFTQGNSPYETGVNPIDENRWYPMVQYQEPSVNIILSSGPGTAKIAPKQSVEAKCEYTFIFKFGGNPAPMVELTNPTDQPQYPIPNNFSNTTSLQDPTTPPELFLYNFDERRSIITKAATERICKDWQTKKTLLSDATTTPGTPAILQAHQTSEDETSDEEKEEETLFQQFLRQRTKQQLLKHRIKNILKQMTNM